VSVRDRDLESGEQTENSKSDQNKDRHSNCTRKKEVKGQRDRQRMELRTSLEKARKTTKWTEKESNEENPNLENRSERVFLLSSLSLCAKVRQVPIRWTVV